MTLKISVSAYETYHGRKLANSKKIILDGESATDKEICYAANQALQDCGRKLDRISRAAGKKA